MLIFLSRFGRFFMSELELIQSAESVKGIRTFSTLFYEAFGKDYS